MDILLLFFPLARCNFLHWLLRSDFPALVKYHRYGTVRLQMSHPICTDSPWLDSRA